MESGEVVALVAIQITVFLGVIALLWQMRGLGSRIDALDAKVDVQGESLRTELRAQNGTIDEVRLQQARQEGINSVLAQDRHTHSPPAGHADN